MFFAGGGGAADGTLFGKSFFPLNGVGSKLGFHAARTVPGTEAYAAAVENGVFTPWNPMGALPPRFSPSALFLTICIRDFAGKTASVPRRVAMCRQDSCPAVLRQLLSSGGVVLCRGEISPDSYGKDAFAGAKAR